MCTTSTGYIKLVDKIFVPSYKFQITISQFETLKTLSIRYIIKYRLKKKLKIVYIFFKIVTLRYQIIAKKKICQQLYNNSLQNFFTFVDYRNR